MPKMLLNHGSMGGGLFGGSDPLADLPIGKWQALSEDSHGLASKGRLINLDTESGKRIYGAMKEGELDGQSIGYRVGEFTRGTKPNEPRRTIKTIKELPEISLVTFPMNDLARNTAVKAADIRTVREFEDFLRDVGGFSHAASEVDRACWFQGRRRGAFRARSARRLAPRHTPRYLGREPVVGRRLLWYAFRTQVGHRVVSEKCQQQTSSPTHTVRIRLFGLVL